MTRGVKGLWENTLIIGHGPSTPTRFDGVVLLVLSIFFGFAAFAPGARLRGAFSYGKGPSVPVGSAGRLILFVVAVVIFI